MKQFWEGLWTIRHKKNGEIISEKIVKNELADDGEEMLLKSFFTNDTTITAFYLRLKTNKLSENSTLVDASQIEPSGNGYAAVRIEKSLVGFPTIGKDISNDWYVISKEVEFTASGGIIGPVTGAFLASTNTPVGKLIAFADFDTNRVIADGDTLSIQLRITLR